MSSMAKPLPSDQRAPRTLLTVVRAAILAGLLAGGVLAVFHAFLTVPVVDQAFAFEAQDTGIDTDPLPLAPGQQQKLALVSGSVVYGVVVGLLLGGVFYLAQEALPGRRASTSAAFLAVMAYWVVGLFPSVKYPANPPGIGLTTLSDYRQALYLAVDCRGAGDHQRVPLPRAPPAGHRWLCCLRRRGLPVHAAQPGPIRHP